MIRRALVLALLALGAGVAASRAAEAPEIRVGLRTGADEARVSAPALLLAEGDGEFRPAPPALRFGVRPGPAPEPARSRWFLDVKEEESAKQAQQVAAALRPSIEAPLATEEREGRHLVVAGPFESLGQAEELADFLQAAGLDAARLREERTESDAPSRLVAVDESWSVRPVAGERARLRAESGRLLLDGEPYRGELELFLDERGALTVVNTLPLEEYLRGVVPRELGPDHFPELEALAAQAVAARTWVLTQIGRHGAGGYDVCPTAHCQVYGGAGAEHELSDRAVRETAGEVLSWKGEPATAFFSSTCGGHTEAVENVFDHEPVPYLKGVACYPERVGFSALGGRSVQADWLRVDGRPAHDILARLWAVGVVDDEDLRRSGFVRRARDDEAATWLRRAARLAGLELDDERVDGLSTETALSFLATLERALGWDARRELLSAADLSAAERFGELRGLEDDALATGLLAMKGGLLPSGVGEGWPEGKLDRGNVLEVIDLWLASRGLYDTPALRFLRKEGDELLVADGRDRERVRLADEPALLSGRKGRLPSPRGRLELKLSDKLFLLGPPGGAPRLVRLEEDPDGAAFDRTSAYSWWERRTPFAEVQREARKRAGVETLADLTIRTPSTTGRVVAVELIDGEGRKKVLEGFPARGLLGLPDSRAHVEVERDSAGRPVAVRATGRGWGHGVGLCQFGAYGMALAGKNRDEILAHYFPGAPLVDLSVVTLPDAPR